MIADLKPYAEYKESGSKWLGAVPVTLEVLSLRTLISKRAERDRAVALNDLEPAHGGLQKMVVILRHGLGYERGDLVVGETGLPRSLAATAQDDKGVAVMPSKRNGDVRVFWHHGIGSPRQSMRQQA